MSLHGTYDPQNVFAQIIRGEAPCYKLYEDDDVLAFLDIFPQSFGHTLVIPKRSTARNILDVLFLPSCARDSGGWGGSHGN